MRRTQPPDPLYPPLGLCLQFLKIVSRTFIRNSALFHCEEDCEEIVPLFRSCEPKGIFSEGDRIDRWQILMISPKRGFSVATVARVWLPVFTCAVAGKTAASQASFPLNSTKISQFSSLKEVSIWYICFEYCFLC